MNRGLKPFQPHWRVREGNLVENLDPMNRGLKPTAIKAAAITNIEVENLAPMKRGVKRLIVFFWHVFGGR